MVEKIQNKIKHHIKKFENILNLYKKNNLKISFDRLNTFKKTNHELLYFKNINKEDNEIKGIFIFGNDFFIKELKDQEFKHQMGFNDLNYLIYNSYFIILHFIIYVNYHFIIIQSKFEVIL